MRYENEGKKKKVKNVNDGAVVPATRLTYKMCGLYNSTRHKQKNKKHAVFRNIHFTRHARSFYFNFITLLQPLFTTRLIL